MSFLIQSICNSQRQWFRQIEVCRSSRLIRLTGVSPNGVKSRPTGAKDCVGNGSELNRSGGVRVVARGGGKVRRSQQR